MCHDKYIEIAILMWSALKGLPVMVGLTGDDQVYLNQMPASVSPILITIVSSDRTRD